jgi:hypothetical protein
MKQYFNSPQLNTGELQNVEEGEELIKAVPERQKKV